MPDVTLVVRGLVETGDSERLERALARLGFVQEVNVDPAKGLLAVSYEGGEAKLKEIGRAVEEAGYKYELSPGAGEVAGASVEIGGDEPPKDRRSNGKESRGQRVVSRAKPYSPLPTPYSPEQSD